MNATPFRDSKVRSSSLQSTSDSSRWTCSTLTPVERGHVCELALRSCWPGFDTFQARPEVACVWLNDAFCTAEYRFHSGKRISRIQSSIAASLNCPHSTKFGNIPLSASRRRWRKYFSIARQSLERGRQREPTRGASRSLCTFGG